MGRAISHFSRTDRNSPKRNFRTSSRILMDRAKALRHQRAQPGVLISNQDGRIFYLKEAAQKPLDSFGKRPCFTQVVKKSSST